MGRLNNSTMKEQETYAGLGSTVYVFRKEDLHDGASFDDLKEKASGFPIGAIIPNADGSYMLIGDDKADVKSRIYTTDNPNPKQENWCQSFSISGEVEMPDEAKRSLFGLDDDDTQHIKADVEFKTPEGKRYFVKDAHVEINVCPALPHKKPLLWDKLPCDMITPLCYPLRWGDRHFNRRIAHYQWMKRNNYL